MIHPNDAMGELWHKNENVEICLIIAPSFAKASAGPSALRQALEFLATNGTKTNWSANLT